MIRKKDLDAEVTVRSKKSHTHSSAKKQKDTTYPDGSDYEDIVLARRRGVFGTALLFLAILLLVLVI
jgi:hypothetical protein